MATIQKPISRIGSSTLGPDWQLGWWLMLRSSRLGVLYPKSPKSPKSPKGPKSPKNPPQKYLRKRSWSLMMEVGRNMVCSHTGHTGHMGLFARQMPPSESGPQVISMHHFLDCREITAERSIVLLVWATSPGYGLLYYNYVWVCPIRCTHFFTCIIAHTHTCM